MRIKFKRLNRGVLEDEPFTEEEKVFWKFVFESERMNQKNAVHVPNAKKVEKLRNLCDSMREAMSDQAVRIVRMLPEHGEEALGMLNCATVSLQGKSVVFTQEHYSFLSYTDVFEVFTRLDKQVQMTFQVNDFNDMRSIRNE